MENRPEKKPHKNRFESGPSGRAQQNRFSGSALAVPAPDSAWRKKPAKKSPGRLLQIGCGEGNFLSDVKLEFGHVFGVDLAARDLKEAARRRLPVVRSDAQTLPYKTASFDFLLAFHAEKNFSEPGQFLAESSRVLKRGGEMIVSLPNPASLTHSLKGKETAGPVPTDWPLLFEAAGLEVFFSGTDAIWDSPFFPAVPSFSQKIFFAGLFSLFFLIEPHFPWQFGENLVFWLKRK